MHSMTGFGRGSADLKQGRVIVEIKTVNHRFLEIRCRSPKEMLSIETTIEKKLRSALTRGYCTVNFWIEGAPQDPPMINELLLEAQLARLSSVSNKMELNLTDLIPVLSGCGELFTSSEDSTSDAVENAVKTALEQATEQLLTMRATEGVALGDDLQLHLSQISKTANEIAVFARQWPSLAFKRIGDRVRALIEDQNIVVDQGRIESESVILADKADISEEISRLQSHCSQMSSLFNSGGAIGRKMEFIIQEMGRETNTIGSKAAQSEISTLVVDIKTELEKMREQAQNVE